MEMGQNGNDGKWTCGKWKLGKIEIGENENRGN